MPVSSVKDLPAPEKGYGAGNLGLFYRTLVVY